MIDQRSLHPKARFPVTLEVHPAVADLARRVQAVIDEQEGDWQKLPPSVFIPPILYASGDLVAGGKDLAEVRAKAGHVAFAAMAISVALERLNVEMQERAQRQASPIIQPPTGVVVPKG